MSPSRTRRSRPRLHLQPLEDRLTPATDTWINAAGGTWATGSNWSLGNTGNRHQRRCARRRQFRLLLEVLESRCVPSTYTVTTTANSGAGSLRQAILDANGNAGPDTIQFSIGTGAQVITPTSALPAISDPVQLDATTQPGYAGVPLIELTGGSAGTGASGLTVTAGGSTVAGLHIDHFSGNGLVLKSGGGNTVTSCYLGTANGGSGLRIESASNTIGGATAADRNVISGNTGYGIDLIGAGATGNAVVGNYVGTQPNGTTALANGLDGVRIEGGANGNTLAANVISGNTSNGMVVLGNGSGGNALRGNLIGTNAAGTAAVPNGNRGVYVDGAPNNIIGGTTPADRNIIVSGSGYATVRIANAGATGNVVQGNYLGLAADGATAIPSGGGGVGIGNAATFNTIGGTAAGAGNVIAGSAGVGVVVDDLNPDTGTNTGVGGSNNSILGNIIGLNAAGTAAVPNASVGVTLTGGAKNNTVDGNTISGNGSDGVVLSAAGTSGNTVRDNVIGLNADGTAARGNARHGVEIITGASDNTVGPGNTVSANGLSGVYINGQTTKNNVVLGNLIGTNPAGTAAFGNGAQGRLTLDEQGIKVESSANNTIGGTAAGAGNVIAGNSGHGVLLAAGTTGVVVQGNYIGTNAGNAAGLGNALDGVRIDASAGNTIGGSAAGAGNVIAGNLGNGVTLQDHVDGSTPFTPGTNDAGGLTLTAGAAAFGFRLSTYIDHFPADGTTIGPMGMIYPTGVGFLATDHPGNVYRFESDKDNQSVSDASKKTAYGSTKAASIAEANGALYMSQGPSVHIIQINPDGTPVRTITTLTGKQNTLDVVTNPTNGHLFVSTGASGQIYEIDPRASPATVTLFASNLDDPDGLTITPDGSTLYAAEAAGAQSQIVAFDVATKTLKPTFPATTINLLDGIVLGSGALAGYLFLNTNAGQVVIMSAADPSIHTVIASGGSRGDFAKVDPYNNTILLTQSDRIERLSLPAAGTTANNAVSANAIGSAALPNGGDGIAVLAGAHDNTIDGDVIAGNGGNGVRIAGGASSGNAVRGNRIGTTLSGLAALPNGRRGVFIDGAPNNTVGGTTTADRNVISGNGSDGVLVANAGATGNVVAGNYVGVGTDGTTPVPNGLFGVRVGSAANGNTVGGTVPGAGNLIGPNGGANVAGSEDGVAVDDWTGAGHAGTPGVGNAIRQNAIFEGPDGVNGIRLAPGGNHDQAAPVLNTAVGSASVLVVTGTLTAAANTSYTLEFFASAGGSPPQGQTFLGAVTITTDAGGQASFAASLPVGLSPGQFVTATATNGGTSDTSSFSAAQAVTLDTVPPTSTVDPLPPVTTTAAFPVNWSGGDNPGGTGLAFYDVYVSDDNGPFTLWQSHTTATSAAFTGQNGHTYGFYSVATDNAGNQETPPSGPQATTTVNTDLPSSTVDPLPPYSPLTFPVHWSGTPGPTGTAIAFYDIYVSDNGGAFSLWLSATAQTTAPYTGQDGHTYGFYSIATDTVGDEELAPGSADATTRVDGVAPTSGVTPLPATAYTSRLHLTWAGADDPGGSGVVGYDVYVSDNGGAFTLFRDDTTATAADFLTRPGHTYSFYSLATDGVGNVQSTFTPATTTIGGATSGTKFTFADDDGDLYAVSLTAPGSMQFLPDDPDLNGKGPVGLVVLQGTDPARSKLTVQVKKTNTGDGRVSVGSVEGTGLKWLNATASDVFGSGINLTGPLGHLTVRDIAPGATVDAPGTPAGKTAIKAHVIGDGVALDLGTSITSFRAAAVGTATITAPRLGTLSVTGDAKNKVGGVLNPIRGDFAAALTLTGTGDPKKPTTLTSATIRGNVTGAWAVAADAGAVTIKGATAGWDLTVEGAIRSLTLGTVTGTAVAAGKTVGFVKAQTFVGSRLLVGFTPTDPADPFAGGTFAAGSKLNGFQVTGVKGLATPAFGDSVVAAAGMGAVTLKSVATDNGGLRFGLLAADSIKQVTVTTPALRLTNVLDDPTLPPTFGDFEVRVL